MVVCGYLPFRRGGECAKSILLPSAEMMSRVVGTKKVPVSFEAGTLGKVEFDTNYLRFASSRSLASLITVSATLFGQAA